jgi:uncharacterized membrane protein
MRELKLYACLLPIFLLVDLAWVGWLMKDFYSEQFGEMARRSQGALSPRWGAAILTYLLIPLGLVLFIPPRATGTDLGEYLFWGALYGAILYGVYDLTNRAVLENFSLKMTLVDLGWGTFICMLMSGVLYYLGKIF